jgi:hypothetical protein
MANEDLQDEINVTVNVEKADFGGSPYPQLFAVPERVINSKLKIAESTIAPAVGRELAQRNKKSQQAGIKSLDAICKGNLFGSITIKGGNGGNKVVHYRVGTNLRKSYPHYVVYGRPTAVAHGKALKFKINCDGEWLYRKWTRPSRAKNYLYVADFMFRPQISGVVEREVSRVLGN